jgi:hypothetical protein
MGSHSNLALKPTVADGTMIRQSFRMRRKVFGQVVLAEKSLLTDSALVRLNTCVTHFVAPHVRAVRELHVAHVAFEYLAVVNSMRFSRRGRFPLPAGAS